MFPLVYCGFPGVGKSTVFNNRDSYNVVILDSDSSTFDKALFPGNYIQHIKEETSKGHWILASSHDVVRAALVAENIPFHLIFPSMDCKMEYLQRYVDRGSPPAFVEMMYNNWEKFVNSCMAQEGCSRTVLQPGQFMCNAPPILQQMRVDL